MSSGSNNFYGTSAPKPAKPAPKPPPRKNLSTTSSSTTTATRRANAKLASRNNSYQSNRAVPPARPSAAPSSGNSTSKLKPATKLNKPSSSFGSSSNTMRARKAPSRPVGSYYNASAPSTTKTESTTTSSGSNLYGTSSATTSDVDDTWDDWGSPSKPTTAPAPAPAATSNPHSSWAAPAPAAATTSSTTDWYSSSSTTSNYTSSGFGNQSSQQQQQQQPQQTAAAMQPGSGFFQTNTTQQQQQQPSFLSGAMDSSAPTMMSNPNPNNNTAAPAAPFNMSAINMFMPSSVMTPQQPTNDSQYPSIEDEAPLLEELGINIPNILLKSKAVIVPFSRFGGDKIDPVAICKDGDLPGPVIIAVALGGEMVLTGKLQFGYIYVYGLFGCIAMTLVVNLMSPAEAISFWTVTSIMGYALLPVNILALVKIFVVNLIQMETLGYVLGGLTVLWSTFASTRLLELGCGLRAQRYLVMYPLLLFYSAFVMMTIL